MGNSNSTPGRVAKGIAQTSIFDCCGKDQDGVEQFNNNNPKLWPIAKPAATPVKPENPVAKPPLDESQIVGLGSDEDYFPLAMDPILPPTQYIPTEEDRIRSEEDRIRYFTGQWKDEWKQDSSEVVEPKVQPLVEKPKEQECDLDTDFNKMSKDDQKALPLDLRGRNENFDQENFINGAPMSVGKVAVEAREPLTPRMNVSPRMKRDTTHEKRLPTLHQCKGIDYLPQKRTSTDMTKVELEAFIYSENMKKPRQIWQIGRGACPAAWDKQVAEAEAMHKQAEQAEKVAEELGWSAPTQSVGIQMAGALHQQAKQSGLAGMKRVPTLGNLQDRPVDNAQKFNKVEIARESKAAQDIFKSSDSSTIGEEDDSSGDDKLSRVSTVELEQDSEEDKLSRVSTVELDQDSEELLQNLQDMSAADIESMQNVARASEKLSKDELDSVINAQDKPCDNMKNFSEEELLAMQKMMRESLKLQPVGSHTASRRVSKESVDSVSSAA